jgi:hypothetical protein
LVSAALALASAALLGAMLLGARPLGVAPLPARPQERAAPAPPQARPPTLRESDPAAGAEKSAAEPDLASLARAAGRHEFALRRALARRDALLQELGRVTHGRSLLDRLLAPWRRRHARDELEAVVAELHRLQARLLEVRARRAALLARSSEREWARLEALVAAAAEAWREGQGEEPLSTLAIAEALDRAAALEPGSGVERYRSLVERLARLNAVIARKDPRAFARPAGAPASVTGESPPSRFLGVAERGAELDTVRDGSLAAWERLRAGLVEEILATASEITRRARRPS